MGLMHIRRRRAWVFGGCALVVAGIVVAVVLLVRGPGLDPMLRSPGRKAWRDQAVASVRKRAGDRPWIDAQLAAIGEQLKARPYEGGWVADEMLVMKNGEWIICQSVAAKEQRPDLRHDLFVGQGSDGRWYYSTFHFCVHKVVLSNQPQPASLAEFVDGYWLAPFDGGPSDESLRVTWEHGPYGSEKLQMSGAR